MAGNEEYVVAKEQADAVSNSKEEGKSPSVKAITH